MEGGRSRPPCGVRAPRLQVDSARSCLLQPADKVLDQPGAAVHAVADLALRVDEDGGERVLDGVALEFADDAQLRQRSEEHTSELQSPDHLVCRLLLEKKKNKS